MIDLEKRDIQDILDDMVDGFLYSTSATNEEYAQAQSLVSQAFCLGIDRKQAEINELKQKLEKLEAGEFVLVPREPTDEIISHLEESMAETILKDDDDFIEVYQVMIEAVEKTQDENLLNSRNDL